MPERWWILITLFAVGVMHATTRVYLLHYCSNLLLGQFCKFQENRQRRVGTAFPAGFIHIFG